MGIGRWLLLHFNQCFLDNSDSKPHVLLLSATSCAGTAPGFDIQLAINGILSTPDAELAQIEASSFEYKPILDREQKPIRISGLRDDARKNALKTLIQQLIKPPLLNRQSYLEAVQTKLPPQRQRIMLVVGSYLEAFQLHQMIEQIRPDLHEKIIHLVPDQHDADDWSELPNIQRGMVYQFAETQAWILIVPLLAVERGHNILNQHYQAAIGAVFFLIRPHPRPDDLNFAIHSINRWAVETIRQQLEQIPRATLDQQAGNFRHQASKQWRNLLTLPMRYSTLPQAEHIAVTWSQLVSIWQVIGRLVRGGVAAQVFFCDAAFALPDGSEKRQTSLLLSMIDILRPYFNENPSLESVIIQRLYAPLYKALVTMKGIEHDG